MATTVLPDRPQTEIQTLVHPMAYEDTAVLAEPGAPPLDPVTRQADSMAFEEYVAAEGEPQSAGEQTLLSHIQRPETGTPSQKEPRTVLGRLALSASQHVGARMHTFMNTVVEKVPGLKHVNPRIRKIGLYALGSAAFMTGMRYGGGFGIIQAIEHHLTSSSTDALTLSTVGGGGHSHQTIELVDYSTKSPSATATPSGHETNPNPSTDPTRDVQSSSGRPSPTATATSAAHQAAGNHPRGANRPNYPMNNGSTGNNPNNSNGNTQNLHHEKGNFVVEDFYNLPGGNNKDFHQMMHYAHKAEHAGDLRIVYPEGKANNPNLFWFEAKTKHGWTSNAAIVDSVLAHHSGGRVEYSGIVNNANQLHHGHGQNGNTGNGGENNHRTVTRETLVTPNGTHTETVITEPNGYKVAVIDNGPRNGEYLRINEGQNVMTPYGNDFFYAYLPNGVKVQGGNIFLSHDDVTHVQNALEAHGLHASIKYDDAGNITHVDIKKLQTGDPIDMQFPVDSKLHYDPNTQQMTIILPNGTETTVHVPDSAVNPDGYIDFYQIQPTIKSQFANDGVTIVWHGHVATIENDTNAAAVVPSSEISSLKHRIASQAQKIKQLLHRPTGHEDNDDVGVGLLWGLVGAVVGAGIVAAVVGGRRRRERDTVVEEHDGPDSGGHQGGPTPPGGPGGDQRGGWWQTTSLNPQNWGRRRPGRGPETPDPGGADGGATARALREQARRVRAGALDVAHSALLVADDEDARRTNESLIEDMRSGEPDDSYALSERVVNNYSDRVLDVLDTNEPTFNGRDALIQHLAALGIPIETAEFRQEGDHVVIVVADDNGANAKRIAAQLAEQFRGVPTPDSFLSNDQTADSFDHLVEDGSTLGQYNAQMRLDEDQREDATRLDEVRTTITDAVEQILDRLATGNQGRVNEVLHKMGLSGLANYSDDGQLVYTPDTQDTRIDIARRLSGIVRRAIAAQEEGNAFAQPTAVQPPVRLVPAPNQPRT